MPVLAAPSSADRSYRVALIAVLAFAAVEVLATAIHFGTKFQAQRAASRQIAKPIPPRTTTPAPTTAPAPPTTMAPPSSAALSAADRLLKEATVLRERGDTANALARLQEAAQRDPRNAQVLAEMAAIYESIQVFDRSNETWRRIAELGASAGPLYELAKAKLQGSAAAAASPSPAADAAGKPVDTTGIPEGSVFGISDVQTEAVPDPDAETNLRLKIAVRKRPNVAYEVGKLRINVFLYDLVDDSKVALTDADTNSEWLSPTHDWSDTDTETLIVSYRRSNTHAVTSEAALSAAAAAVTPGKATKGKKRGEPSPRPEGSTASSHRRYLGYLIRVYYNDQLQTVRADPARLVRDAPPISQ